VTVWINPIAEEADSSVESNGRIVNTYSRTYQYKTNSMTRPTEADIIADIGIVPGSPYDNDPNATASKVRIGPGPEMTRPPYLCYHVQITWATNAPLPAENSTDPTTRRILWSIRPSSQSTYIIKDRLGKLIVNSVGQPFDGGIPVDVRYGMAIAKRSIADADFDKSSVVGLSGRINDRPYLGGAAGTVQVDIDAEQRYEGAFAFWDVTYTFNYRPDGWQPKPANVGFFWKVPFTGKLEVITVADLNDASTSTDKVQEPEPLYDDAAEASDPLKVSGTVVPYSDRPDGCSFVTVDFYEEYDFSLFGLGV
jgi:hypothetical protein